MPRSLSRSPSGSAPGTPFSFSGEEDVNTKLQYLATQVVKQTVHNRSNFRTLGEVVAEIRARQEEMLALTRAEEARRQNRVRSLAGQPLVPVVLREPPSENLPAIISLAALDNMSTPDLGEWYAYYTSASKPPHIARESLLPALAVEVGLTPPPPPSYAQATKDTVTPSKPLFELSPQATKCVAILAILAATIALSVLNRNNGSLQNILQQIVQIIGQYLLKTSLAVRSASVQMLSSVEEIGSSALHATRLGDPLGKVKDWGGDFKAAVLG